MYNQPYNEKQVQVSAVQMISAALVLIVVFVIPAGWFESQKLREEDRPAPYTAAALAARQLSSNDASASGQVAGESTGTLTSTSVSQTGSSVFRIPFTSIYLDLQTNGGLLTVGGIALFGVGICLVGLVLIGEPKPVKAEKLRKFEFQNLDQWA